MSPLERRARRIVVDTLLEKLAVERQELYRRKTFGATRAGLRDLKGEHETTRSRLALALGEAA